MPYLITMRRRAGQGPSPVHAPGMSEDAARIMAAQLASLSHRVTLSELADNGAVRVLDAWIGGKRDTSALNHRPAPRVIDHEPPTVAEAMTDLRAAAEKVVAATDADEDDAQDEADAIAATAAEDQADDDAHHYTANCFRCKEKRDFVGHIVELSNGSRAAKGNCPVCGSGLMRMVARTTPLDEWSDDDVVPDAPVNDSDSADTVSHELIREDRPRGKVRLSCSCDEWETTVASAAAETRALASFSEHAAEDDETEDTEPAEQPQEATEDDAEASEAAAPVLAFSDAVEAVQEAQELAPAVAEVIAEQTEEKPKRAPRKSRAKAKPADDEAAESTEAVSDAELDRVKAMEVAHCPICGQDNVPFQKRASITYFLTHPGRDGKGNATDRCPNSLGSDGLSRK